MKKEKRETEKFNAQCQSCGRPLEATRLECPCCAVQLTGRIPLPRLARLTPEEREFVELFLICSGSLKDVGRILDLSYPSVRQKLNALISRLRALRESDAPTGCEPILAALSRGEIDVETAAKLLKNNQEKQEIL